MQHYTYKIEEYAYDLHAYIYTILNHNQKNGLYMNGLKGLLFWNFCEIKSQ